MPSLRYRQIAYALVLMLFALGLRWLLLVQRIESDPSIIPQAGTDHYTYVTTAQALLSGEFPTEPYYFHPAPTYLYAALLATVAPTWLHLLFVLAVIDALTSAWLFGAVYLLTRKIPLAVLASLLFALYPVSIFYGVSLLIENFATHLLALFIFLLLWQKEGASLWRSLLLGVVAGAIALSRLNLVPILLLYALYFWDWTWRKRFLHAFCFALFFMLTLAPFTWWNYYASGGHFIPVATTGSLEIYMANNRDSNGRHGTSPALAAIDTDYQTALIRDIQVAPEHFIGLLAYKFGLFWTNEEPGNNLSYAETRANSALLRALPFSFLWLVIPAVLGWIALVRENKRDAFFLAALIAWICASYSLTFAFARLRYPVVIPFFILIPLVFTHWQITRRIFFTYYAPSLSLIGAFLLFGQWVVYPTAKLPSERIFAALPDDARLINADFGDMHLLAWKPVDGWQAAERAWTIPQEAYTVELFWQLEQATEQDYQFYLSYVSQGTRYAGIDRPLGGVSFPLRPTSTWQAGQIYSEIVSFKLQEVRLPIEETPLGEQALGAEIHVGVYYQAEDGQLIKSSSLDFARLQAFAVYPTTPRDFTLPENALIFGDAIALVPSTIPALAPSASSLNLDFQWCALQDLAADYSVFLHVVDNSGEISTQGDTMPVPNLPTSTWQAERCFWSSLPLTLPTASGEYHIYMGLYQGDTRLSLPNGENRLLLGQISLE